MRPFTSQQHCGNMLCCSWLNSQRFTETTEWPLERVRQVLQAYCAAPDQYNSSSELNEVFKFLADSPRAHGHHRSEQQPLWSYPEVVLVHRTNRRYRTPSQWRLSHQRNAQPKNSRLVSNCHATNRDRHSVHSLQQPCLSSCHCKLSCLTMHAERKVKRRKSRAKEEWHQCSFCGRRSRSPTSR